MKLSNFDYNLPSEFIAQTPLNQRALAKLLVYDRKKDEIAHKQFFEITDYLKKGDLLVLNNTKVIPCRLHGYRRTGGKVQLLLIKNNGELWDALFNCRGRLSVGEKIELEDGNVITEIVGREKEGRWKVRFQNGNLTEKLYEIGRAPLPPYIKRPHDFDNLRKQDRQSYQTVFAKEEGAIAAPTAGLHFTKNLIRKIKKKGVEICYVTLHVSTGTFLPVRSKMIEEHKMGEEEFFVSEKAAEQIRTAKYRGGRVIAVGTTVVRVLETLARKEEGISACRGNTSLFIFPPFQFKITDILITNFHLPKSTLLMLVASFIGREKLFELYETAKNENYRFYSFGDAMILI